MGLLLTRVTEQWYTQSRKIMQGDGVIMPAKSISHCQGKGSLSHNNRTFSSKNVDSSRTADNITFIKQPIAEAYEKCFGAAVQRYNEKQTRADRQIKNGYFQSVFDNVPSNSVITSSDKRKSFYEDLIQIGTKDDTGVGTADGKLAVKCLTEYMEGFKERNPNMYVFNAVLHQDEATPHLHIDYIPIGHYKRGIDTQNGLAQALKEQGYTGKDAINKWRISERKILEDICKKHGIEISEPQKSRGYSFTVDEYKEYKETIVEQEKQLKQIQSKIESEENLANKMAQKATEMRFKAQEEETRVNDLKEQKMELKIEVEALQKKKILSEEEIKQINIKKSFGKYYFESEKNCIDVYNTALEAESLKKENHKLTLERDEAIKEAEEAKKEKPSLKIYKENIELIKKNEELIINIEKLKSGFTVATWKLKGLISEENQYLLSEYSKRGAVKIPLKTKEEENAANVLKKRYKESGKPIIYFTQKEMICPDSLKEIIEEQLQEIIGITKNKNRGLSL